MFDQEMKSTIFNKHNNECSFELCDKYCCILYKHTNFSIRIEFLKESKAIFESTFNLIE